MTDIPEALRTLEQSARSWQARHERFNPGPPSNPRRLNFYGHFRRSLAVKRYQLNQAHGGALREDAARRIS